MKYLIIGGVAGGASAAARIRRNDEFAEIVLFERGKYISYANCGLPYYIGGVIDEREKLFVQTPISFRQRFNIDVRTESEVISIDAQKKEVVVRIPDGSSYTESYDKLLMSPGSMPFRPPLKGIDFEGIFVLRNVEDTDKIKNFITNNRIKKSIVIGAGFIGLEMAENLQHIGSHVTVIEMENQVMAPIDFSMASIVHQHLIDNGVGLYLEEKVELFEKHGNEIIVVLKSGQRLSADLVILSVGVRPETNLAVSAGLKLGERGGILVDEYLQTSDPNIYAVGDAIEYPHPITNKPWLNYLANPANRQGRIVADNIVFGNKIGYEGAIGTSIAKIFDIVVASTGVAAKHLKRAGIKYQSSTTHSGSHAGYYPGATSLSIKITFDPDNGTLFGGQIVGYEGVDKRIDQIALIIKNKGTIYDLIKIEHAYAPPFSSAKDPIAIAGYVAENIITGEMPICHWRDIDNIAKDEVTLLDVRTQEEFMMGNIAHSINIPLDEIRSHIKEIPTNKPIYTYCGIGLRGYLAAKILIARGFKNVKNLSGGYTTYSTAKKPITIQANALPRQLTNLIIDDQQIGIKKEIKTIKVDACGLQCPGPIMKVNNSIKDMSTGDRLEITSTDAGFARDAEAWCKSTGNTLVDKSSKSGIHTVIIEKGTKKACTILTDCETEGKTFIVFSDQLDKVLASFVLANGAAATGKKVTMFFTFWGLGAIKKTDKPKTEKDFWGRMFSRMLPSSSLKLNLSKMSMGGIGKHIMRKIMNDKGIESLETLRQQAIEQGVEFIACQMSMDVMGVKKEELIDGVTIGGVATYMERAESANVNLFI